MKQKRSSNKTTKLIQKSKKNIANFSKSNELLNTFAAAIGQSTNSIIILNADGIIQYANHKALEWYNLKSKSFIGKHWKNYIIDDSIISHQSKILRTVIKNRQPWQKEILVSEQKGKKTWRHLRFMPLKDSKQTVFSYVFIAEDITDRKLAEESLQHSEERFRVLSNSTFEAILIHNEGILLHANEQFYKLFGFSPDETLGKQIIPIVVAPDEVNFIKDHINSKSFTPYKSIGLKKDGKAFPMEVRSRPIEFQGEKVRVVTVRDLTDQKRFEKALMLSEEKYKNLFNSIPIGLFRCNANDGKFIECNNSYAQIFNYETREECVNDSFNFVNYIPSNKDEDILKNLKHSGEIQDAEIQATRKDGSHFWLSYTAKYFSENDIIEGAVSDITERKNTQFEKQKLENQLQQAQKMEAIGALAGGIAHDFNNLLMGVLGCTSLIMSDINRSHPHYEFIAEIENHVQSAVGLTRQLLGFAREGKYEVVPTNINNLIKKHNRMFGRTRKEITILGNYDNKLWTAEVDQTQIEQILMNLYVNAWQAMPNGGKITVQTKNRKITKEYTNHFYVTPGKYIHISVADTGIGMDKDTQNNIFDPFFTTKEKERGTGMGLSSTYGIIKNHNGFIMVDSEPGKGSVFHIYLPASKKKVKKIKRLPEKIQKGDGTLLLIDDEALILNIGKKLFEKIGYEVFTANSGENALKIYKSNKDKIDLVILDLIMPEMSGDETFTRLKSIDPKVKILLSSGYSVDSKAKDILDKGCDGFIQKPFNIAQISQRINKILAR